MTNEKQIQEKQPSINEKPSKFEGIKRFFRSAKRIFVVSKKPSTSEYKIMSKVTGIGIIIIGIIGFILILIFSLTGLG